MASEKENTQLINTDAKLAWKEFLKSPLLLIFFVVMILLGYVITNWVVKDKNDTIKKYEGQIEVWQQRQESWILTRDKLQQTISELNRLVGGQQVLDSLNR